MLTLETRSPSGARIDDHGASHTLTSPARVQETGCGTRESNGILYFSVELTGKRLELLKQSVPSLKSVIIFTHRGSAVNAVALNEAELAAPRLGLGARLVEVRDADEVTFLSSSQPSSNGDQPQDREDLG
jgi:hypothetical protein